MRFIWIFMICLTVCAFGENKELNKMKFELTVLKLQKINNNPSLKGIYDKIFRLQKSMEKKFDTVKEVRELKLKLKASPNSKELKSKLLKLQLTLMQENDEFMELQRRILLEHKKLAERLRRYKDIKSLEDKIAAMEKSK